MGGFCGFTGGLTGNSDSMPVIENMMGRIAHRGPDSRGVHCSPDITLGALRLSFLDLQGGTQPMYNEDKNLVIAYNGEIYNYKPLRAGLVAKGHVFSNYSDTEVLLHLYEEHGALMLPMLRGMFAFVIYDIESKRLFGARDPFGVKPFYYSTIGSNLLFGSEIKCFLEYPDFIKEVNPEALENYLTFQYSVLPETFFKGVYKLPPGHYMLFESGKLTISQYFELRFEPVTIELKHTVTAIDKAVQSSVQKHRISDVEIGTFLSSGVDSSYVAALSKNSKTFTVGFDYDNYNEIEYAKELSEALGIQHFSKTITTEEYWGALPKVQYHMDEPLADPAAVALYFASKLARGHVKAALSGEGADEFFGGYNIYKEPLDLRLITSLPMPLRKFLGRLAAMLPFSIKGKNFFIRGSKTIEERFIGNARIFSVAEREKILLQPTGNYPPGEIAKPLYDKAAAYDDITKMQYIDIHLWMVGDILLKADKMSMAHSLELRSPLVDREVFKVASRIPTHYRVNKTDTKYAFRQAAREHLPEQVASKKKLGFPVPIRIWLREEKYYARVKDAFTGTSARKYFNVDGLIHLLNTHKSGKIDNSRKIWTVYMFLVWHEEFF